MRLLVLAPEPVDAAAVRDALGEDAAGAEVRVVSPALHSSPLTFLMDDHGGAIADAEEAKRETVEALESEGVRATGDVGDADPLTALQDALATFRADRVLVFVHPEDERRYREDDVIGEAERRFGVPVTESPLPSR